ncbi:MAG: ribonuclease Z [Candidatus Baldrarchaeia archaeon]
MYIVFLGTSGTMPTKTRNAPAIALKYDGELMLFDCGEGTQRQLLKAGLGLGVSKIFITHIHGDHVLGVPGLLQTFSVLCREKPLEIYGPPGIRHFLELVVDALRMELCYDLHVYEVKSGTILETKRYKVVCVPVEHNIEALAYAFIEKDRPGKFHPDRALKLGVPRGPLWKKLQEGVPVTLPDGRTIRPEEVVGPPRPGRKIVYSGDTRPCDSVIKLAQNADVLIHEGTFSSKLKDLAHESGHSTVEDAAKIAKEANVKKLVVVHISPRHQGEDIRILEEECRSVFKNSIIAYDLFTLEVTYP